MVVFINNFSFVTTEVKRQWISPPWILYPVKIFFKQERKNTNLSCNQNLREYIVSQLEFYEMLMGFFQAENKRNQIAVKFCSEESRVPEMIHLVNSHYSWILYLWICLFMKMYNVDQKWILVTLLQSLTDMCRLGAFLSCLMYTVPTGSDMLPPSFRSCAVARDQLAFYLVPYSLFGAFVGDFIV